MKPKYLFQLRHVLAALLLSICLAPELAMATGDDQTVRAQYDSAVALYAGKQYDSCKKILVELWVNNKTHDVATLYGQVENKLGHFADSARYYTYAIEHFPPTEPRKQLETIKSRLRELQKQVMTFELKVNVADVTVNVDGGDVDSKTVFLEPGAHIILVRKEGFKTADRRLEAKAGTSDTWEVTLQADEKATATPVPTTSPSANQGTVKIDPFATEPPKDSVASKPNPWILVGGGVVTAGALVTGLVFNSKASSAKSDGQQIRNTLDPGECTNPSATLSTECNELKDKANTSDKYRAYASVGFVAAGVVAVGTVAYWLWSRQKPSATTARRITVDGAVGRDAGALWISTSF